MEMRIFFLIIIIFLCAFFQTAIFPTAVTPDLVLIAVISINLFFGFKEGIVSALVGGLLLDVYSGFFGVSTLALVLISYILHFAKYYLFTHVNILVFLILVLCGTIFYSMAGFLFAKIFGLIGIAGHENNVLFINMLVYIMPREIAYNLSVAVIVFLLFKSAKRHQPSFKKYGLRANSI